MTTAGASPLMPHADGRRSGFAVALPTYSRLRVVTEFGRRTRSAFRLTGTAKEGMIRRQYRARELSHAPRMLGAPSGGTFANDRSCAFC